MLHRNNERMSYNLKYFIKFIYNLIYVSEFNMLFSDMYTSDSVNLDNITESFFFAEIVKTCFVTFLNIFYRPVMTIREFLTKKDSISLTVRK